MEKVAQLEGEVALDNLEKKVGNKSSGVAHGDNLISKPPSFLTLLLTAPLQTICHGRFFIFSLFF